MPPDLTANEPANGGCAVVVIAFLLRRPSGRLRADRQSISTRPCSDSKNAACSLFPVLCFADYFRLHAYSEITVSQKGLGLEKGADQEQASIQAALEEILRGAKSLTGRAVRTILRRRGTLVADASRRNFFRAVSAPIWRA